MSQTDQPITPTPPPPPLHGGKILGHPKALWQLFNIEMDHRSGCLAWEMVGYGAEGLQANA